MKMVFIKNGLIALAIVVAAWVLGEAWMYKYRCEDKVVVTGLGEQEFTSDLIVWDGCIAVESGDRANGYAQIERDKSRVLRYLKDKGVDESQVRFNFVDVTKVYNSMYSGEGKYMGERWTGVYRLTQRFEVESGDVEKVEKVSREISSLIAEGLDIDVYSPSYYCTKLDEVKQELIKRASADARERAENIARNAGARLGKVMSARLGVFQITGVNSDEDYAYGGTFNTSSREKVGRITVRVEYRVK